MDNHLLGVIIEYRYLILIPLSFVEGPVVAFFSGMLASLGYFSVWELGAFFFLRDVLVDSACWGLGYWGAHTAWVGRLIKRLGVTEGHVGEVRALWQKYPGRTMFFSKLSYGVAAGFIVVAGFVQMPFRLFLAWGSVVAVLQYLVLLGLGYFFGVSFGGTIVSVLDKVPYVLLALSLLALGYYFFRRYMTRRLKEEEQKVSHE